MRPGRALGLTAMLAVQAACVFADGTVSPPNPVGEKLYYTYVLADMLPLAIVTGGILLALLLYRVLHRPRKFASDYEI